MCSSRNKRGGLVKSMTHPKRSLDASLSYLALFKIQLVDSTFQPFELDFSPARFSSTDVGAANLGFLCLKGPLLTRAPGTSCWVWAGYSSMSGLILLSWPIYGPTASPTPQVEEWL